MSADIAGDSASGRGNRSQCDQQGACILIGVLPFSEESGVSLVYGALVLMRYISGSRHRFLPARELKLPAPSSARSASALASSGRGHACVLSDRTTASSSYDAGRKT